MFKKPFTINQTHKVSGADRKKIRRAVEKALQPSEECLELLLPSKAGDLELAKLPAPSRLVIYTLDKVPVIIDVSGKNDFVPTVMGLWQAPLLLPQLLLKHPAVSQFIVGGADLMLPGADVAAPGFPTFTKGTLVSIWSPGNPAPIAVGRALMNSPDIPLMSHSKGKLVEVIQVYGDCLWADLAHRAVPNEGFLPSVVIPVGGASSDDQLPDDLAGLGLEGGLASDGAAAQGPQLSSSNPADIAEAEGPGAAASEASTSGSQNELSMEELLELALLQALHKGVQDEDLPLAGSALWVNHMVPSRPPGTTMDVKKSAHKKMSKFLQHYAKQGLLQCKEDKHSGDMIITSINRKHDLYYEFRPYKTQQQQQQQQSGTAAAGSAPAEAGAAAAAAAPSGHAELVIQEVYAPSRETKGVFEAVGASTDGLYTGAEAAEVVLAYVKQHDLEAGAPDNKTLVLDPVLCDALYKGLIKKGDFFPTHIPKAELRGAFTRRLQPRVCISRGQLSTVRKGAPPTVHISTERRQGNKQVTRIVGMEDFLVPADVVARECQKKFASSTTIAELPGKQKNGHEVIIQGNMVDKVADYLISAYGIPKKYFLVKR